LVKGNIDFAAYGNLEWRIGVKKSEENSDQIEKLGIIEDY
jgi:hypothetical protein